jgi:transposase
MEPMDLRKSIDGLVIIIQRTYQLDVFQESLFVFCNRAKDKIKIIHWDNGFWLYYRRLEQESFKWPSSPNKTISLDYRELEWLLNGHEVRAQMGNFKEVKQRISY